MGVVGWEDEGDFLRGYADFEGARRGFELGLPIDHEQEVASGVEALDMNATMLIEYNAAVT